MRYSSGFLLSTLTEGAAEGKTIIGPSATIAPLRFALFRARKKAKIECTISWQEKCGIGKIILSPRIG